MQKESFKRLMSSLDVAAIKKAILDTWNMPEGTIFREIGFEIIDERMSEEESDRIYAELFAAA